MIEKKGEALINYVGLWVDIFLCLNAILYLINFTNFYARTAVYLFYSFYSVLLLVLFDTVRIYVLIKLKIRIF